MKKNYIEFRVYLTDIAEMDSATRECAESIKDMIYEEIQEIEDGMPAGAEVLSGDVTYTFHIGDTN